MLSVFYSLIPVILTITLGLWLNRKNLFSEEAWRGFENLCYFILFPALLIKTLATADIGRSEILVFSGAVLSAILAMSVIMLALYPILKNFFSVTPAQFTSLFQGATRWHGFIALSIVGFLYSDEGVAYTAITMAVIIPPLNVINVSLLAVLADREVSLRNVLKRLISNPFILACLIGAFLNLSGIGLPVPFYSVFDILGGGALGLGLLTVGAGLHFGLIRDNKVLVGFGAAVRLLGMPMLMFAGTWLFGIDGIARTAAVIAGAVPTASSAYVLARQMGGDAPLMANLITVQVVAAVVTLPAMIWLAGL